VKKKRWQAALMPMSHHRDLGIALYQPLLMERTAWELACASGHFVK